MPRVGLGVAEPRQPGISRSGKGGRCPWFRRGFANSTRNGLRLPRRPTDFASASAGWERPHRLPGSGMTFAEPAADTRCDWEVAMKRRKFLKSMTALAAGSVLPAAPAIWTPATTVCPPIVGPSLTICPGREFAASSFVHTPLADNAPLDPNSAAWVTHIQNEVAVFAFVNIDQYCPPIYIVDAMQPTMQIKGVRAWDPSFDQW